MPPIPVSYVPQPFVRPAYVPDQSNLLALMQAASQARQQATLQHGAQTAQGRYQLASLLTAAFDSIQRNQDRKSTLAIAQQKATQDQQDKDRSFALQTAQFNDLAEQRDAAMKAQQAAEAEKSALRVGGMDAGPISQGALDAAQADPSVAARTRYSFGPGTAEGPELLPTSEQKRLAAVEEFAKAQGGVVGPSGQVVMPPKAPVMKPEPTLEQRLTGDDLLNYLAAQGNQGAINALKFKNANRPATPDNEPLVPVIGPDGKPMYARRSDAVGKNLPAGAEKPSSGVQKHTLAFFNRAEQADKDLEELEPWISGLSTMGQARLEHAPNIAQSSEGQRYVQAQRAFTEARLRKDSGAAIPDSEFANDRRTYFPVTGDDAKALEQKRRARAAILSSLAFESGQALGEFLGDADEAAAVIQHYKGRAAGNELPANSGKAAPLKPGTTVTVGKYQVKVEP
jgi:hypothetical protein